MQSQRHLHGKLAQMPVGGQRKGLTGSMTPKETMHVELRQGPCYHVVYISG